MRHEKRIIDAFKSNDINKVLLIDDAYDPPSLNDSTVAELADFLEKKEGQAACFECGIEQDIVLAAAETAEEGDTEGEELEFVYQRLYQKFAQTGKKEFDPGSFILNKEPSLADLRPLQALLRKCGKKVEVRTAGLGNGIEFYKEFRPEVLFLDYYLEKSDGFGGSDANKESRSLARRESQNLLKEVVKAANGEEEIPAIVLMSSRNVDDIEKYRHQAGGKHIISLRFQFLKKTMLRQSGSAILIDHEAADALLDMSQGYLFGKMLQQALSQWKIGAQSALNSFMRQIGDLHLKDFAYLLRFRLREENQPLSEYLEWLFGEYLRGLIDQETNWKHPSFSRLDNESLGEQIEGAFEGPTVKIAQIFHSVRVNSHRVATRRGYQLGDLYAQTSGNSIGIRVVITPDCDLVVRKGKTKAESVLTMGGALNAFDQKESVADDFFLHKETPYSVRWHPKDLQTFPVKGRDSLHDTDAFEFLGTLRPLYAQEMQRRALTDLSRVGLPVAPALGLNAEATAWLRTNDPKNPFKRIPINSSTLATIIPSRAGRKDTEGHRVLLCRPFVNDLIDQLKNEINSGNADNMSSADAMRLNESMKNDGTELYNALLGTGGLTKARGKFGTGFVLGKNPDKGQAVPWLQIVLAISEEAMEELRMTDPLAMSSDEDLNQ